MDQLYDFSIIEQAGLTQKEFGELCNVSRVTVNLWVSGKMSPHRYIRDQVSDTLTLVSQALAEKRLPIPENTPRDDRMSVIAAAVNPPVTA